jgi:hypothetical protein
VKSEQVLMTLNTDFSTKGLASQDVQAIVAAWQASAISQDTMFDLFRRGEVLPEGRTNSEEANLIKSGGQPPAAVKALAPTQDAPGQGTDTKSQMADGQ